MPAASASSSSALNSGWSTAVPCCLCVDDGVYKHGLLHHKVGEVNLFNTAKVLVFFEHSVHFGF